MLADNPCPQVNQRIPLLLSERDSLLFNIFGGEGGGGPVVLAAVCGIKVEGLARRYLHCTVTECLSPLLCGRSRFILYVPCSLLY